jgi:hypothetical protein
MGLLRDTTLQQPAPIAMGAGEALPWITVPDTHVFLLHRTLQWPGGRGRGDPGRRGGLPAAPGTGVEAPISLASVASSLSVGGEDRDGDDVPEVVWAWRSLHRAAQAAAEAPVSVAEALGPGPGTAAHGPPTGSSSVGGDAGGERSGQPWWHGLDLFPLCVTGLTSGVRYRFRFRTMAEVDGDQHPASVATAVTGVATAVTGGCGIGGTQSTSEAVTASGWVSLGPCACPSPYPVPTMPQAP